MSVYEASITNPKKQLEFYKQLSEQLQVENKQLKQKYEMQKDSNKLLCKAITCDDCNCKVCEAHKENIKLKKQLEDTKNTYLFRLDSVVTAYKNQQKEFINFLENEKDRLARECSQIYEDSLGKIRLVNEDIFNEVDKNLSKYKEINHIPDNGKMLGVSNENNIS